MTALDGTLRSERRKATTFEFHRANEETHGRTQGGLFVQRGGRQKHSDNGALE